MHALANLNQFATTINYERKMLMKLTEGGHPTIQLPTGLSGQAGAERRQDVQRD
jgi:hypothetical protein